MAKPFMELPPEERQKEWLKRWKKGVDRKIKELEQKVNKDGK